MKGAWDEKELNLLEDGYLAARAAQMAANQAARRDDLEDALKLEADAHALVEMVASSVPMLIKEIRRLNGWATPTPVSNVREFLDRRKGRTH